MAWAAIIAPILHPITPNFPLTTASGDSPDRNRRWAHGSVRPNLDYLTRQRRGGSADAAVSAMSKPRSTCLFSRARHSSRPSTLLGRYSNPNGTVSSRLRTSQLAATMAPESLRVFRFSEGGRLPYASHGGGVAARVR